MRNRWTRPSNALKYAGQSYSGSTAGGNNDGKHSLSRMTERSRWVRRGHASDERGGSWVNRAAAVFWGMDRKELFSALEGFPLYPGPTCSNRSLLTWRARWAHQRLGGFEEYVHGGGLKMYSRINPMPTAPTRFWTHTHILARLNERRRVRA